MNNLQNKPTQDLADIAKRLTERGYVILKNSGKQPLALKGWNSPTQSTRSVRKWNSPTIGVVICDGLGVLDIDVDDPIADKMLEVIEGIAPDVALRAPTRFGGGEHKMALFVRIDGEAFNRLASHRYLDADGQKHLIESFGGARTRGGFYTRQFGAYGAHTIENGRVVRNYVWAEGLPALHDLAVSELPALTAAQASAICAEFEKLAEAAGWTRMESVEGGEDAAEAFDITDDTRFACNDGRDSAAYDDLSDNDRCSSSFHDGLAQGRRDKCRVFFSPKYQCLGVYDYETLTKHFPAAKKPVDTSSGLASLKALATASQARVVTAPSWRDRYANGSPKPSLENAERAIVAMGVKCSYDAFRDIEWIGRDDAAAPGEPLPQWAGQATDARLRRLRTEINKLFGVEFAEKHIFDAAGDLAFRNSFDPLLDMLAEAESAWDGVARFAQLPQYFSVEDTPLHRAFLRKTLIAAVARARVPGIKFDTILTLEGPEGWNKSTAFRVLAGDDFFSDVAIIGLGEQKIIEGLAGVWIHENAELAGMKKAEVEVVKDFASRQVNRARLAYDKKRSDRPRRSIEIGTTNADTYLQSQSGNRRFWPIKLLAPIDVARLKRDRLQLWGEAAHYQSAGESLVLDRALWGAAGEAQAERRVADTWEAVLSGITVSPSGATAGAHPPGSLFIAREEHGEERVLSSEVHQLLVDKRVAHGHASELRRLADVMRHLGWQSKLIKWNGKPVRGYVRTRISVK